MEKEKSKKQDSLPAPVVDLYTKDPIQASLHNSEKKPVEYWRDHLNTPDWLFNATMAGVFRCEGFLATQEQYKAACAHTSREPVGYTVAGIKLARDAHKKVNPLDKKQVDEYAKKFIKSRKGA